MSNLLNPCMQAYFCTMQYSSHQLEAATLNELKLKFQSSAALRTVQVVTTLDGAGKTTRGTTDRSTG